MSIVFSDTTNNLGIVQQVRDMMRVDSSQWATSKIVNSVNNHLDTVAGYAIGADKRFQWDDTNHTKLPVGTTALVSGQTDYSFLTDEQGNSIITLTGLSLLEIATNRETKLYPVDMQNPNYNFDTFGVDTGTPTEYDKIADNIIKLDLKPSTSDASKYKLKFYFQRTPSYFSASDTTKSPGVSPLLHRGFVVSAAYDGAMTLGLDNLQALSVERAYEMEKMKAYFPTRVNDEQHVMRPINRSHGSH